MEKRALADSEGRTGAGSFWRAPRIYFILISVLFSSNFLLNWDYIGVGDWELFTTMAAIPYRTIVEYHQFPLWNPYLAGGNILFAHPEVSILSPLFLLVLLFGPLAGLKFQVLVAYFLGFYGSYLLARRLDLSPLAAALVSIAYFGSSYFALHFSIGHMPFTHFCFLPWFLYFLLKSDDLIRYLIGAAVAVALIILGNGAAIPFLYTVFFSGLTVALFSFEFKTYRYLVRFVFSVLGGVLLAGIKFVPMVAYLTQNRWPGKPDDRTPLGLVFDAFFSFNQDIFRRVVPEQLWGWHEYSAYISPVVALLALVAVVLAFKKSRLWLILGVFFFIFGLGHFSSNSPWNLILKLPGFSSIRCPSRAFQFVILSLAIMSGIGLDTLMERYKSKIKDLSLIAGGIVGIVLIANYFISLPGFLTIRYKKPENLTPDKEFRHVIGRKDDIYNQFLQNHGSLTTPWLSGYKDSRALVTPLNEVMMEYLREGQAEILSREFTPNKMSYEIRPSRAGTIVFSIGYDEGWKAKDGRQLFEQDGLLATRFNEQDRTLVFVYHTPYFWTGALVSFLSALGLIFIFFNSKALQRLKAVL